MSSIDIPGRSTFDKLAEEVLEASPVFDVTPVDVSAVSDPGMRAVISLAVSLGWNVVHKRNKPVTLIARDGFKHVLPTNTSVRFNVYMNRVNATIAHSITALPSPELMDKIIKLHRLDPSHARVLRAAGGEGVMDGVVDVDNPDEHLPPSEEPDDVLHMEYTIKPFLAHAANGQVYNSEAINERTWADGRVDYVCPFCGKEGSTPASISTHYGYHVRRGEVPKASREPILGEVDVEWVKARHNRWTSLSKQAAPKKVREIIAAVEEPEPPEPMTDEEWAPFVEATGIEEPSQPSTDLTAMVAAFQRIIDEAVAVAVADLQARLDAANAEVARLLAERAAFRDLLS